MSINETSGVRICYLTADEAAFAAGKGAATKYLATAVEAGDKLTLTGMNYPNGSVTLGIPEVERKQIKPVGAGANKVIVFSQGYRYKEFTYSQYIHTDKWMKEAIACSSGAIPASHLIHLEIPAVSAAGVQGSDYFDLVGCVLQKYEIELSADDFPKETLTFFVYDMVDSVAVTDCPNFVSTQPATHKDCALTLDGDAISCDTMKITIENELLDSFVSGKYQRIDPYLKGRMVDAEIETYTELAGQFLKPLAINGTLTAISLITLVFTISAPAGAAEALTITNLYTDTTNSGEIPEERDLIKWKLTLKMGGDCSITSA
jgi:hypothetical protein